MSKKSPDKKTIAIFTAPQGHFSIAQAIQEKLQDNYNIVMFEDRDSLFDLYVPFYQFFPAANSIPFSLATSAAKRRKIKKMIETVFYYRYKEKIEAFLEEHRPDVCISTHFIYNANLVTQKRIAGTPFINVITDPRTISPFVISGEATTNVCFENTTEGVVKKFDPSAKTDVLGWFVREQFEKKVEMDGDMTPFTDQKAEQKVKQTSRKKLGLNPNLFTILIASGSEGTNMILKLLPALFSEKNPVQIVVACGSNKKLFGIVSSFQKLLTQTNRPATIIPIEFSTQMDMYMRASDIVVGKAGPNTIFESVACKRPFFAITHIAGQEDGNLDLIREYKIGFVEEKPRKAQKLLQSIIKNPDQLAVFSEPLAKLAAKNALAGTKLHALIAAALAAQAQK